MGTQCQHPKLSCRAGRLLLMLRGDSKTGRKMVSKSKRQAIEFTLERGSSRRLSFHIPFFLQSQLSVTSFRHKESFFGLLVCTADSLSVYKTSILQYSRCFSTAGDKDMGLTCFQQEVHKQYNLTQGQSWNTGEEHPHFPLPSLDTINGHSPVLS